MPDIQTKYGADNQAITVTLASLANGSARESTAVDNSANLFLDALVQLGIASGTGVSSTGYIAVYAYGSADGGTTYSDGATGSDSAHTLTDPPNAQLIGIVNVVADGTTYESQPMSVATAFGGVLPDHWGIIVDNQSGDALAGSGHDAHYQGIYAQSA